MSEKFSKFQINSETKKENLWLKFEHITRQAAAGEITLEELGEKAVLIFEELERMQ